MNDVREVDDDGDLVVHGEGSGGHEQQPGAGTSKLEAEPAPSAVRCSQLIYIILMYSWGHQSVAGRLAILVSNRNCLSAVNIPLFHEKAGPLPSVFIRNAVNDALASTRLEVPSRYLLHQPCNCMQGTGTQAFRTRNQDVSKQPHMLRKLGSS